MCSNARGLVDFQAQSVTGAMEKSLHSAMLFAGLITLAFEEILHRFMDFFRLDARPHFFERELLAMQNGVVKFPRGLAGATADDRPSDVAEITGLLRARKNVEDNQFIRAQRAE